MDYSIIDYVYKHAADWGIDPVATGRQLKELRRQHNLTQKDLSELFDYCYDTSATREYISILESGKQIPSIHFLVFLCELYACSLDELVVSYRRSYESEDRDQPVPLVNYIFYIFGRMYAFAYVRLFLLCKLKDCQILFSEKYIRIIDFRGGSSHENFRRSCFPGRSF